MDYAHLYRSIAEAATSSDDGDGLLAWLGCRLVEGGLPIWRIGVSMPAIDVMASSVSLVWQSDTGSEVSHVAHGEENRKAYLESPIRTLVEEGGRYARWRLDTLRADEPYPVLHEFRAKGGTDYILHLAPFTPGTALRGMALSFVSRTAGGFSDEQATILASFVPVLGLAMAKVALSHTMRGTLGTYLGPAASEEVLSGRILRGEGRTIWAAILLVDLRGFTALTDCSDPADVVSWLDEHLDALGEPVQHSGGEILKFLGDGFLAVFPVAVPDARTCLICEKALDATIAAQEANRRVNGRRRRAGLPELEADLVLHFGEVVYGNVGTRRRLDFTVIGCAVNEASRIEKTCDVLDRSILVSDTFAARCRRSLVPVGEVKLRGLDRAQRVWSVAAAEAERVTAAS